MSRYSFRTKGNLPMAVYVFIGLIPLDPSPLRTSIALVTALAFFLLCSRALHSDEHEAESWRWSTSTTRAISAMLVLCFGALLPFGVKWLRTPPNGQEALQDGISLVAYLIFAFLMGVVIYLMLLLRPISAEDSMVDVEALKLEHQSCLALFQTGGTCMVVIFLGALLTPTLAPSTGSASPLIIERLGWAFYCFAGGIAWFLRPCLARAKYIRHELGRVYRGRGVASV